MDKSRNRTWGRVLTPRPIIIRFWQLWSNRLTSLHRNINRHGIWTPTHGKWHICTGGHLWLHPKGTGVCVRRRSPSVSLKPLSPLHSDVKPKRAPLESRCRSWQCTSYCLCPFIWRVPLLLCFSLAVHSPSHTTSQKINHNPWSALSWK